MTLTNRMRLPAAIVAAIDNDSYSKHGADISVTELLSPPKIVKLRRLHEGEIDEDASERIWSLLGQAVHTIIERASSQVDSLTETTIFTECLGWKIKGTTDNVSLTDAELLDYKVTTVWKLVDKPVPQEWVDQTNLYRYMLWKEKGLVINAIAVIAILRDWSQAKADSGGNYPPVQVMRIEIPVWTMEEAEAFLEARVRLHQSERLDECSDGEIWAKPSTWAIMKKGNVRAKSVHDSMEEARAAMTMLGSGHSIEYRAGRATRCERYCPVAPFCEQWQNDPRNSGTKNMEGFLNGEV